MARNVIIFSWSIFAIICVTNAYVELLRQAKDCTPDPEVCMNASQLITSKGYPCEEYTVRTNDGFLLGMQRIPSKPGASLGPVFLQHGLLGSSANWLTNLANESLAYILADAGFDVWLGNVRGNVYSRKHVKFTPDQKEFWAWSWDEMAELDLPAMVDFVLAKTGRNQLQYVAHSQGTLIMFAHLADNPQFAKKIRTFLALAPVATVAHIDSPLKLFSYLTPELQDLFNIFGVHEFLPQSWIIKILGESVCKSALTRILCEDFIFLFTGFDRQQLNETRIPVYLGHTPAGTSVQNMVHFAQGVRYGNFSKYDYGSASANRAHYGQPNPPQYNLSRIVVDMGLFYGDHDWLADRKDVDHLLRSLSHQPLVTQEIPGWDHLDFLWAMNAPNVLYNSLVDLLKARA